MYRDGIKDYLDNLYSCIRFCSFIIFPTINTVDDIIKRKEYNYNDFKIACTIIRNTSKINKNHIRNISKDIAIKYLESVDKAKQIINIYIHKILANLDTNIKEVCKEREDNDLENLSKEELINIIRNIK